MHRAELRPAHAAELRALEIFRRQCLVVIFLRPIGIVEMVRTGRVSMTRGVNDGIRRVAGTNGNRYEDVMELAEMVP